MINKKYLKLLRTKDRKYGENFIYNEISKNIIDSLDILKVPFNNILELGINDKLIINYLKKRFFSRTFIFSSKSILEFCNTRFFKEI